MAFTITDFITFLFVFLLMVTKIKQRKNSKIGLKY